MKDIFVKKLGAICLAVLFVFSSLLAINSLHKTLEEEFAVKAFIRKKKLECVLGNKFFKFAHKQEESLKSRDLDCFTSSFIKDRTKAMQKLEKLGGKNIVVSREGSQKIHCTFFDRKSDTLLVLGVGFPVVRQRMLPFVKLFPKYDLLLFDYPGIGSDHNIGFSSYFFPWRWKGLLSWAIAKVDFNVSSFGATEEKDVITVVDYFKKQKDYKNVFGLGLCFSSYTFAKAAAKRSDLFNKLILDGNWPSVERVVRTIAKNPSLISSAENPRSPLPCLTDCELFQSFIVKCLEWVAWANIRTASLKSYLSKVRCPVLFFQCLGDCYCDKGEFAKIWDSVKEDKIAVFTRNVHGRNHVWQAEGYKAISERFFDLSCDEFVIFIKDYS